MEGDWTVLRGVPIDISFFCAALFALPLPACLALCILYFAFCDGILVGQGTHLSLALAAYRCGMPVDVTYAIPSVFFSSLCVTSP